MASEKTCDSRMTHIFLQTPLKPPEKRKRFETKSLLKIVADSKPDLTGDRGRPLGQPLKRLYRI